MKIPKWDLVQIMDRLVHWTTFSDIAKEYWVSAWTLQKRLNVYHPYSSSSWYWKIWEEFPNYQEWITIACRKYGRDIYHFEMYFEFLHDYLLTSSPKNKEYFRKCKEKWYEKQGIIFHLQRRLLAYITWYEPNYKLIIDEKSWETLIPWISWTHTDESDYIKF